MKTQDYSLLVKAKSAQAQRIKCSIADHFVAKAPVSVVFFYRCIIPLDRFIHSLEEVLSGFPIFAGILIKQNHQLYIDCVNQGVPVHIEHLSESIPLTPDVTTLASNDFFDAIHPSKVIKHKQPLLTIRLRYYLNGMSIGFCWHHTLGDMSTFMTFLKALSSYAESNTYQAPLIVEDREQYLQDWIKQQNIQDRMNASPRLISLKFMDVLRLIKNLCWPKKYFHFYFDNDTLASLKKRYRNSSDIELSRNDIVCALMLHLIAKCRNDKAKDHHASIAINYRKRMELTTALLGNYVDTVPVQFDKHAPLETIATLIHEGVQNYVNKHACQTGIFNFLQTIGGMKKLTSILPADLIPKRKNLIISNWSNFGVYSIDYGIEPPYLFLPFGRAPLPWLSCIVEGRENQGLLFSMALPPAVAKRLRKMKEPTETF